jgi:hypothetical protein
MPPIAIPAAAPAESPDFFDWGAEGWAVFELAEGAAGNDVDEKLDNLELDEDWEVDDCKEAEELWDLREDVGVEPPESLVVFDSGVLLVGLGVSVELGRFVLVGDVLGNTDDEAELPGMPPAFPISWNCVP